MNTRHLRHAVAPHVALVFGTARERSQAAACLRSFYSFTEYPDMAQFFASCRARPPVLAVVGEVLPWGTGFDLVRRLRLDPALAAVPVVMVVTRNDKATLEAVALCGAERCLVDPYTRSALITTVSSLLNQAVERSWEALALLQRQALSNTLALFNGISDVISKGEPIPYRTVSEACTPLVEAVATKGFRSILNGVRDHDNYAYARSMRVATFLALFGSNLHLSKDEQIILAGGGLLHDVGKMGIPHEVLNKPERLTAAELAVMKGHVTASVTYLKGWPDLPRSIITIAAQHHEKLDGTGYPCGLAGTQLDRLTRMTAIIDVFSALTDRRVYKPPMDAETALKLMREDMGAHLDLALLGLFRQMLLDATQSCPGAV